MLKNKTIITEAASEMMRVFTDENATEEAVQAAFDKFGNAIAASVGQDYLSANGDATILAQRGFRQLTNEEKSYYQKIIDAGKTKTPVQSYIGLPDTDKVMPETIIQDVYKDLTEEHPLLSRINFQNVSYLTRWILNDHTAQTAAWGDVNDEITKQITSAFRVIEVNQCKLSAYAIIEKDMLDLGPTFLDNYIRTFLKESLACALEKAIISGTGLKQPIGLDRDIHKGVSFSSETGYPQKTPVAVKSFLPAEYGKVLSQLAKTERGTMRKFDQVTLVCNQVDYLEKVMPATTVLNANGTYSTNLFPFPTEVIRSNEMETGKALVFLPEEYFFGLGSSKDGTLEYSDDFKFLADQRVYKIKMHGMGRAWDNTVAVLLDISKLNPAYITVLQKTETAGA